MWKTESLTLTDGRVLCYATFGAPRQPRQPTVFYLHGTPGSHAEGQGFHEAALERGVHIVAPSRPGYGGSTFQPDRTISDHAADVLRLADHLEVSRFAVLGMSGGGPYALACIRSIPSTRLAGVVVVSGMYPSQLGLGGMMPLNRVLFNLAPWATGLVSVVSDWQMGGVARDAEHPEKLAQLMTDAFQGRPVEDRQALVADDGRVLRVLVDSTREAFRDGGMGFAWESRLFGSPWGFELGDLEVEKGKLVLWHSGKDVNIPLRMAREAAAMIRNVELVVDQEEAHVSLLARRMDDIASTLVQMLRAA